MTAPFPNGRIPTQHILSLALFRNDTSLVNDILVPLIGILMGGVNFAELTYQVGSTVLACGKFIQAIINFLVIAFVLFLIIRSINRCKKKEPAPAAPTTKECPQCATTIPLKARRCPNCTSQL